LIGLSAVSQLELRLRSVLECDVYECNSLDVLPTAGLYSMTGMWEASSCLSLHSKLNSRSKLTNTVGALPSFTVAMWFDRGEMDNDPDPLVQT
jgi:hypothetical protein